MTVSCDGQDVEKAECSCTAGGNMSWDIALWKGTCQHLTELTLPLPAAPQDLHRWTPKTGMCTHGHHAPRSTAALHKCPSTVKRINK